MDLISRLNWRYAVKKMSGAKPDEVKIQQVLEAARLSASSYGFQPYKLVVVTDGKIKQKLQAASFDQEKVSQASHILVFATRTNISDMVIDDFIKQNAKVRNENEENFTRLRKNIQKKVAKYKANNSLDEWMAKQAYIALGTVLTSAAILEVDTCPMEGFEPDKYDDLLGLSDKSLKSVVVCAVGVRSKDDDYQKKKKVRWSEDDFFVKI